MHDLLSATRVGLSCDLVAFLLNGEDQLASRNTYGISLPRHLRGCCRLLQPSRHALLGLRVRVDTSSVRMQVTLEDQSPMGKMRDPRIASFI